MNPYPDQLAALRESRRSQGSTSSPRTTSSLRPRTPGASPGRRAAASGVRGRWRRRPWIPLPAKGVAGPPGGRPGRKVSGPPPWR